jgi:hypothetical protein
MTADADAQASDLNMGRVVEMYLQAEITLAAAKSDIVRLIGGSRSPEISADLDAYLNRMLEQMRVGDLQGGEVRTDLVSLASLASMNDPDFARRVRQEKA